MSFLKKHYEKILLAIVLVGLAVAVALLPFLISGETEKIDTMRKILAPKPQPLTNLDLTAQEVALSHAGSNITVDFANPNRLFNPVPWKRAADGKLIKMEESNIGPRAVAIAKITPLNLNLKFDSVKAGAGGAPLYVIASDNEATGKKKTVYAPLGVKEEGFIVRQLEGPTNEPTKLFLELLDTGEKAVLTKDQGFSRIEAYKADLKYAPEIKSWPGKRVGTTIALNGEEYKIVAITKSEVVLSAPNQKKWTITAAATTP